MKISIVSYLNTAPFIYGIESAGLLNSNFIELSRDVPSVCAQKLLDRQVDVGLVPVAILPLLGDYKILGNTCIGAVGKVDSVVLLSQVPIEEIREIVLDPQSRTSVNLCRILARDYWKIDVNFIPANSDVPEGISGDRAMVLIGDRVFDNASGFTYVYDLSEAWMDLTGLPFVFAVWASRMDVSEQEFAHVEAALQDGLASLDDAISLATQTYPAHYPIENYLRNRISYTLDAQKRKGLETFLHALSTLEPLSFK